MIFIRGIEVTQGIQYFRADQHLTDPADRGPDNSLVLVAGKTAWIRVFVETDTAGESVAVTGSINVSYPFVNDRFGAPSIALAAQPPGTVTASHLPDYVTVRRSIGQTLNFIVSDTVMHGPLDVLVTVTSVDGTQNTTFSKAIQATLQQTLKVRGVLIGYNGPNPANPTANLAVAAPGLVNLQNTAAWALRVDPVSSAAVFEVATTITQTSALTGTATNGGCTTDWVTLNTVIANAKTADGNKAGYFYYGLLAAQFPNSSNNGGCESGGVASGFDGGQTAFAHELGHYTGRAHAPCGGVGTSADSNYPAYEPYDSPPPHNASIGEYGLDITSGAIPDPNSGRDFMSYCGPPWISIYGHKAAIDNEALNPERVGLTDPWWKRYETYDPWWWLHYKPDPPPYWIDAKTIAEFPAPMRKVISLVGVLQRGKVAVLSVARTEVVSSTLSGHVSGMEAVLHGAGGKELATTAVIEVRAQASGCGCGSGESGESGGPVFIQAYLADVAEGMALAIRKEGKTLWRQPAKKGQFAVGIPKVRRLEGNQYSIEWRATVAGGAKDTWVRYSTNKGKTWTGAAVGVSGNRTILDGRYLPAGSLLVEVVVHNGWRSVRSKPAALENPDAPPVPAVLSPGALVRPLVAGDLLCLWGSVACQPGKTHANYEFEWRLDGVQVGVGLQVFTRVPAAGKHRCEFLVRAPKGKVVASTMAQFTSQAPQVGSDRGTRT